ncbi:MAG: hypothetical protein WDN47_04475 [Candidatus Doudnabacteria bacterium]
MIEFRQKLKKPNFVYFWGFLAVVFLVLGSILFFASRLIIRRNGPLPVSTADEIIQIKDTTILTEQVAWYKKLIERVGPSEAQDDLVNSGLPFTGQTHLLNHTVGDYLYEKFGVTGLSQCKEYFLASCYHGFILDAIATGGIPEVAKVMNACRTEGVSTVFPQCSHAVGHGFLAFVGYKNLTQSLTMCDDMVKSVPDFPTFNCQDGVFMENIWALHDGSVSADRWVKPSDPVYPCDDSRIGQKYLLACWSNQPSLMYQQFSGDLKKVAGQCGILQQTDLRQMCYNGLARQIHPIAAGNLDQTFDLCGLLGRTWTDYCILVNDTASFSVGDRSLPFAICARIDAASKDSCYQQLLGMINAYAKSSSEQTDWCNKIDSPTWKDQCQAQQRQ